MYNKITNPLTGKKVNIISKLGKKILAYYIYQSEVQIYVTLMKKQIDVINQWIQ